MGRRKVKKEVKRVYFDYSLLFITIFLAAFGIVMIYSTSSYTAQMNYGSSEYYFYKQLTYTLIGFAGMYITYKFDYHFWQRIWKWVMAL
jgi:cell division protein FtsW